MLELRRTPICVVEVFASAGSLDTLAPAGARRCRVAPDEEMFLAGPDEGVALARDAMAVTAGDPDALVLDTTDGWTAWTLSGEGARQGFSRLSELELPESGYTHGDVAHVPVRIFAQPDSLQLLVPAMWGDYLRERILERCASLGVNEVQT